MDVYFLYEKVYFSCKLQAQEKILREREEQRKKEEAEAAAAAAAAAAEGEAFIAVRTQSNYGVIAPTTSVREPAVF